MPTDPACPHDATITRQSMGTVECADCGRVLGPAPEAAALTENELAALMLDHAGNDRPWDPYPTCSTCTRCDCYRPVRWPCDVQRLLSEVQRLRALLSHGA